MTPQDIRLQIMSQATEDFTGLWELAGAQPDTEMDGLVSAVATLIRERLVTVYRGTNFTKEDARLAATIAEREIRKPGFWEWSAPERGPHLRLIATDRGRDWYFAQRQVPAVARLVS